VKILRVSEAKGSALLNRKASKEMTHRQQDEADLAAAIKARCVDPNGVSGIVTILRQTRSAAWRNGANHVLEILALYQSAYEAEHAHRVVAAFQAVAEAAQDLIAP
jgi:hypothetical protein